MIKAIEMNVHNGIGSGSLGMAEGAKGQDNRKDALRIFV